jgi:hypothetical protein
MKVKTLSWAMESLLLLSELDEEVVVNIELMTDKDAVVFRCVNGVVTVEELESSAYGDWDSGDSVETAIGNRTR